MNWNGNWTRVLVTGSRDWRLRMVLDQALDDQLARHGYIVLVHGACPTGADLMADQWGQEHKGQVQIEKFPALWHRHGKAAGPMRNQYMVDMGADVCLAFPYEGSRGTGDCMRRARAAGIPVLNYGFGGGLSAQSEGQEEL